MTWRHYQNKLHQSAAIRILTDGILILGIGFGFAYLFVSHC